MLFWPNEWEPSKEDVTETVKSFYEETPFPNYDDFDSTGSLILKAKQSVFARLLDEQIPFGTRVLECGCGTGQMSIFLSILNRTVFGTDICLNSLRLGEEFRERNDLNRVCFLQMNLFRPVFKPATFDLVICNGVLHHTADPFLGFRSIARLVRQNGYILIGLYHRYGRLFTDFRRAIFRTTGDRLRFLDPTLRQLNGAKRYTWFMDQYHNPHESKHTIGEVLGWFRQTGFEFVHSIPHSVPFQPFKDTERLFEPTRPGNHLERFLVEIGMIIKGRREGGFFMMIGKKM